MKKKYVKPRLEILSVRVEAGYAASCMTTMYLGSNETVGFNGGIHFGNGAATDDGSNMEGIGDGGILYF